MLALRYLELDYAATETERILSSSQPQSDITAYICATTSEVFCSSLNKNMFAVTHSFYILMYREFHFLSFLGTVSRLVCGGCSDPAAEP